MSADTMSVENFYAALHAKLVGDTVALVGLVPLLSHTISSPRIMRARPQVKDRTPVLTFYCDTSSPFISSANVPIIDTMVVFGIYTKDELNCVKIADRLTFLFLSGTMCSGTENRGLNISNLNIVNTSTRFRSRDAVSFSEEYEIWGTLIRASFMWYGT